MMRKGHEVNEDGSFIPGSVCWIDVSTTDPAASREFYTGLFGWTYEIDPDPRSGHYTNALLRGRPVAGLAGVPVEPGQPVTWTLYLTSANVAHTASVVDQWGGRILYGPMDFPGQGRMLIATDPTGAAVGFWQPAITWAFHTVHPGSLVWAELMTREGDGADNFFANLFGYRQEQIGDGFEIDYTTWSLGEHTSLGRMRMDDSWSEETPPHWMLYFAVDPASGTDGAVNRVLELGGTVDVYPFDSSFGRTAVVRDPSGAGFSLIDATERIVPVTGLARNDDPYDD